MDDNLIEIARHQQRRVFERLAILEQLLVGVVEVGVPTLVFPGEVAALPDIGPALATALRADARLKGEALAGRVVFGRRRVAHQAAPIEEVFLRRAPCG